MTIMIINKNSKTAMCCKFKIAATMIGMTSETYGRIAMDIIVEKYISGKIIIVHQPRFPWRDFPS